MEVLSSPGQVQITFLQRFAEVIEFHWHFSIEAAISSTRRNHIHLYLLGFFPFTKSRLTGIDQFLNVLPLQLSKHSPTIWCDNSTISQCCSEIGLMSQHIFLVTWCQNSSNKSTTEDGFISISISDTVHNVEFF